MSFRGGTRFPARNTSPSQIFKKRNDLIDQDVPINSNGTLCGQITLTETGTLYAVKLSIHAFGEVSLDFDRQRVAMWIRCVPNDTAIPDLTDVFELDTINGFSPIVFSVGRPDNDGVHTFLNEKFRYRRKCDANMELQLLAQHTNEQGVGRVVNITGIMTAIIRSR